MIPLREVSMPISYVENLFQNPWVTIQSFWNWKKGKLLEWSKYL